MKMPKRLGILDLWQQFSSQILAFSKKKKKRSLRRQRHFILPFYVVLQKKKVIGLRGPQIS